MSDLDDLAAALDGSAAPQLVAVRREVQQQPGVGPMGAGTVYVVSAPVPPPVKRASPFAAGFFGTFGVIVALLAITLCLSIYGCLRREIEAFGANARLEKAVADRKRIEAEHSAEQEALAGKEAEARTFHFDPLVLRAVSPIARNADASEESRFGIPADALVYVARMQGRNLWFAIQNVSSRPVKGVTVHVEGGGRRIGSFRITSILNAHQAVRGEVNAVGEVRGAISLVIEGGNFW
jgi:hypothetical protein